ncbi:cell wall mannoprotein 1 family protein [Aspergillus mulundensis]|uniref:Uncharacterized protein n=1 Tax=Aspergillus mulundensis TaxID=1810919 RepID=A0A3D8QRX0_9EURO|nr:Uncharacterized protein DSM5745_09938 [Aspergillus mulundensis]RDW64527.1 Uncharacterized protein DSM5745_09938 [Aspergillus mulundensis]
MKFHTSVLSLLLTLTLPSTLAQSPVDNALAQFRTLNDRIDAVQSSIDGYSGGLSGVVLALPVANSLYSAHTAASTARTSLSALDPLSPADSQRALDAYNEVHPRLIRALNAGRDKAAVFKDVGVGYVAQGMISNLYNEKNRFEEALRAKVYPGYFQNDLAEAVDAAFQDTLARFS